MNLKNHVRRAILIVAVATSVAATAGAVGAAHADTGVPQDPPAADVPPGAPADDSPPGPVAGDEAAPSATPTPPEDGAAVPPADVPSDPGVVAATGDDAAAPTSTTPASPAPTPPTTPPPAAIATTTVPRRRRRPRRSPRPAAAPPATAPRSPVATPGNTTVKLTWRHRRAMVGRRSTSTSCSGRPSAAGPWTSVASPTTLSYTDTGLANGTHYYFRILAHNSAGYSPASTTVNAVPRTVPTAPRSPVATAGNTTVKLTWLAPSSNGGATIDKYLVQRATSAAGPWANVAYPTTLTCTNSGLTNGTHYYVRMRRPQQRRLQPSQHRRQRHPADGAGRSAVGEGATGRRIRLAELEGAVEHQQTATIDQYVVQRSSNGTNGWANAACSNGSILNARRLAHQRHDVLLPYPRHNAAGWSAPAQSSAPPRGRCRTGQWYERQPSLLRIDVDRGHMATAEERRWRSDHDLRDLRLEQRSIPRHHDSSEQPSTRRGHTGRSVRRL